MSFQMIETLAGVDSDSGNPPPNPRAKGFSELHPACFPPIRLLRYDRI